MKEERKEGEEGKIGMEKESEDGCEEEEDGRVYVWKMMKREGLRGWMRGKLEKERKKREGKVREMRWKGEGKEKKKIIERNETEGTNKKERERK